MDDEKNLEKTAQSQPVTPAVSNSKKKLMLIVSSIIGLLLIILIVLLVLVLTKDDSKQSESTQNNNQNNQQATDPASEPKNKKLVKTVKTNTKNVELLIYEPKQNSGNTTVDFALKYTCDNCGDDLTKGVYATRVLGLYDFDIENIYSIDNASSQKYGVVTDKGDDPDSEGDDKALITPSCDGELKSGEQIDCFATFAQIPSGSTVSIVLGESAPPVDGIKVP